MPDDHDRRSTVLEVMSSGIGPQQSGSRLPQLVDLVIAASLVTADTVAATRSVTPQVAWSMIAELGLREITGRGRFRVWAVA